MSSRTPPVLDPDADLVTLLRAVVDIESVSGNEGTLADAVMAALAGRDHLYVTRHGDAVVARTNRGLAERVVVAGHLDTVPVAGNLPSEVRTVDGEQRVYGRGSCDMKGGVAVMIALAAQVSAPVRDVTWIFYDNEEVEASRNGLGRLVAEDPTLLAGDFAVLMEPSGGWIEGGCQGTCRFTITTRGVAAHSARSWLGHNAIHDLGPVLDRIAAFNAREIVVDELTYREGLNAVAIGGGIAGNVVPDRAHVSVNYRFAPDKSPAEAEQVIRAHFADLASAYSDRPAVEFTLEFTDMAPAARPGLDRLAAQQFVRAVAATPRAKYGWTDVARFAALGVPAVNFGPGDPGKAHTDDEYCPVDELTFCAEAMRRWLTEETA